MVQGRFAEALKNEISKTQKNARVKLKNKR